MQICAGFAQDDPVSGRANVTTCKGGNGTFAWLSAILTLLGGLALTLSVQASSALSVLNLPRTLSFALAAVLFGLLSDEVGRGKVLAGGLVLSALAFAIAGRAGPGLGEEVLYLLLSLGLAALLASLLVILLDGVRTERLLATASGFYLAVGGLASLVAQSFFQIDTLQVERPDLQVGTFQLPLETGVLGAPFGPLGIYLALAASLGIFFLGLAFLAGRRCPIMGRGTAGRKSRTVCLLLASWLAGLSIAFLLSFLSPFALEKRISSDVIRFLLMALPVPVILAQFLAGPIADLFHWAVFRMTGRRSGRMVVALLGALLLGIGFVLLLLADDISALTNAVPIIGVGYGLLGPSLIALVAESLPRRRWGLAAGLYLAVAALSGSPVLALLGGISPSTALSLALASPFLILVIAVVLLVSSLRPEKVLPDVQ